MGSIEHDRILSLIGVCSNNETNQIEHIVMELMDGDLLTCLRDHRKSGGLTLFDLVAMSADVASGCCFLEELKFVHRDIAARNCLFKNIDNNKDIKRIVKIGDFGLARDVHMKEYYRMAGIGPQPVRWMSPESLNMKVFTSKSDIWSFGLVQVFFLVHIFLHYYYYVCRYVIFFSSALEAIIYYFNIFFFDFNCIFQYFFAACCFGK